MVQQESILFTVGIFVVCALLLLVDLALKKWYQPYLANRRNNHVTATKAGVFGTEAIRVVMAAHDAKAEMYEQRILKSLAICFDKFGKAAKSSGTVMEIVSGWTDEGVNAISYRLAKKNHWKIEGIACKQAIERGPLFECDKTISSGIAPGDEKVAIAKHVDMLVLVSDNSDPDDPYEIIFNDFSGMKLRFDISKDLNPPEMFNASTIMDELDHDKDK